MQINTCSHTMHACTWVFSTPLSVNKLNDYMNNWFLSKVYWQNQISKQTKTTGRPWCMVILFNIMSIFLPMNFVLLNVRVIASTSSVLPIATNRVSCVSQKLKCLLLYSKIIRIVLDWKMKTTGTPIPMLYVEFEHKTLKKI